jgi:tRNA pseudouridine38-40 synthase
MEPVRYQLKLAYDGTHYKGFQRQAEDRTVQLVVESALRKLGWTGNSLQFAGRTDTGVHATGQIIAFDLCWNHSTDQLIRALNANLPEDVAATTCRIVDESFHPRFDACARNYCYTIISTPTRQPLFERYAWRVWPPLDFEALQNAAGALPGVYDCAAFGRPPVSGGTTIRAIYDAHWEHPAEDTYLFFISANAFLYHMVRRIVYCLVRIGLARMTLAEFTSGIQSGQLIQKGLAPANGLSLREVRYQLSAQEFQLLKTSGRYHLELTEIGDINRGKNLRD